MAPLPLALLGVGLLIAAALVGPFLAARRREDGPTGTLPTAAELEQYASLLAERVRVYSALAHLDRDHAQGRSTLDEYRIARRALVSRGVHVLQQIDLLPALDARADDPVEHAVRALRQRQ